MRTRLVPWLVLSTIAAAAVVAGQPTAWREITAPHELVFPRDDGAHPDVRTEWWYVTGLVDGDDGARFGFQVTFFRRGMAPGEPPPGSSALRARQIAAAHLAIVDLDTGRFRHAQRLRRWGGGLAGASTDDLEVWLDDWVMQRQSDGVVTIEAHDPGSALGVDLEFTPNRPQVLHGNGGLSRKGAEPGNGSVYLSWTRLEVRGRVEVAGSTTSVTGTAWFDHEWGSSQLGAGIAGWDWFGLRLADGRDLMVYLLRRTDGSTDPFSSGTLVEPDGSSHQLDRHDLTVEARQWWTSPVTGARYPVSWQLRVPDHAVDLEIRAPVPACELDGRATTGVVYWEGPVVISGSVRGEGYVELTGYAGSLDGRF